MCATCGCDTEHHHEHGEHHDHPHAHPHTHGPRVVALAQDVLAKNDGIAAENRTLFAARGIAALNFVSAPGSGKTSLLEATIRGLSQQIEVSVIEGDQATERDADRIRATGCPVVQVNTGTGCHLDAEMVRGSLAQLAPAPGSLLFIENVGNLVCPAMFDLGERGKVVLMSVTEGEDKPLKYPHMFRAAQTLVLTKIDLLPHLDFDVEACLAAARRVNPALRVFTLSARTGAGVGAFCNWLAAQVAVVEARA
jgi:hydrogenase nickel incorporation protein HypB